MANFCNEKIRSLPLEIIEQLVVHLGESDLIELLCVSNSWYTLMRPFCYRSVVLNTKSRFSRFLKTLEQPQKNVKRRKTKRSSEDIPRFDNLGANVRVLKITDVDATIKSIQQLATLCPNVTTVIFDFSSSSTRKIYGPNTRRLNGSVSFFDNFHPTSLTSLKLIARRAGFKDDNEFLQILSHVPQLESLTLSAESLLSTKFTEYIHESCPNLKVLEGLYGTVESNSNLTMAEIEAVTPARAMQKLCLRAVLWKYPAICEGSWFKYITRKYPMLKHLDISSPGCIQFLEYGNWKLSRTDGVATITLQNYFPNLEELCLSGFAGQPSIAWPQFVKGIPTVEVFDNSYSLALLTKWLDSESTKDIRYLRLPYVPRSFNHIHQFKHLKTLVVDNVIPEAGYPELDINALLSSCPTLETLKIVYRFICYDNVEVTRLSNLRVLILDYTVFQSYDVLTRIGEQCPRLVHLDMEYCNWIDTDASPVIRIYMPQSWFAYYRITQPKVYRNARISTRHDPENLYWILEESYGFSDSFMVKTEDYDYWSFFYLSSKRIETLPRHVQNCDALQIENGFDFDHLRYARKNYLKTLEGSLPKDGCCIAICFRGVGNLYINSRRISSLDNNDLNRTNATQGK